MTDASAGAAPPRPTTAGWVLAALVVVLLLTQRVVLPFGGERGVALSLLLQYLAVVPLLLVGAMRADRLRGELYALAVLGVLVATWVVTATGHAASTTSLGLLLALYLPWLFRSRDTSGADARLVGLAFVRTMAVVAALGVLQLLTQLAGVWTFRDYLRDVLPADWVASSFNFANPLEYGSAVVKGNGFVMLEPSFLSQFCALAVGVALLLRMRLWWVLVLLLGLASAVSGTGILLLVAIGLLVVARSPQLLRPSFLVTGALVVVAVALSPIATLITDRAGETSEQGSSGYLRFVQPYTEVARGLAADPARYWMGAGSGSSDRLLISDQAGQVGEAVVYTIAPKLVFEYGLPAASLFVLFLVMALLDRTPWPVVPGAAFVMIFFLSGSLLQPQTTVLAWLLTGALGSAPVLASRRRGEPPGPGGGSPARPRELLVGAGAGGRA
ncbi:hypothetical protein [Quadrisphaera sp. KR29]|uniref:hypothetical protein n=1 Tax=Quadrisphaera sp. KR29 TaxID=3461391 RepID=UPI00404411AE